MHSKKHRFSVSHGMFYLVLDFYVPVRLQSFLFDFNAAQ